MIRINLANKKQAAYVGAKTGVTGTRTGLSSIRDAFGNAGKSDLITVLSKMLLPIVLCGFSFFGFSYYVQQKNNELQREISAVEKEKERLQGELRKVNGYETVKTQLDKNAQIIRIKIETVEKLIQGRDFTLKSLVALAQTLPPDVWLSDLTVTDNIFDLRGKALDLGLVTDVMTHLGQSIYFKDVALKNSSMDSGGKFTNFELTARRE